VLAQQPWLRRTGRILTSGETKALETAAVVGSTLGLPIEVREPLHENDRSSTGFVPPARFEVLADAFFESPDTSVEGWETSRAAQRRIVEATADCFDGVTPPARQDQPDQPDMRPDVLIVAHGAVGTLLLCHLLDVPISRRLDQVGGEAAAGGGNFWAYDTTARTIIHQWRPIDRE
jgi:broad specificity phosphatase PhoE